MSERRKIVLWWREGVFTVLVVLLVAVFPERLLVGILALVAISNAGLGILADRDAENWFRLWRDHGPDDRTVRP